MRNFKHVCKNELEKFPHIKKLPELPKRATAHSAGYDFHLPYDITLEPGQYILIPTLVKAEMDPWESLELYIRSSLAYKYHVNLVNNVGLIDADYYGNQDNDGHISAKLYNHGDTTLVMHKGERFMQGVFRTYLTTFSDIPPSAKRTGGTGSTNKY